MNIKQLIDFQALSFDRICARIAANDYFSLARYGDGEFMAILGEVGQNCDGHEYYPEMGRALGDILKSRPPYYIGLHQSNRIDRKTMTWLYQAELIQEIEMPDGVEYDPLLRFVPNAVFHDAQVGKDNDGKRTVPKPGAINQLWKAFEGKKVWVIGPGYLEEQKQVEANHITIPGKNTFEHINNTLTILDRFHDFTDSVVLVCASMCAPIIVDHLYRKYGDKATFIDFGSVFDAYLNNSPFTRSFHQKIEA